MNSFIQCLFYLKLFRDYFINKYNFSEEKQPVSFELKNIMIKLNDKRQKILLALPNLKKS